MLKVPVDFNTMVTDPEERVYINTSHHPELLSTLRSGMKVLLWAEKDLEVEAVIEYDDEQQAWFGAPYWNTMRDLPPDVETPLADPTRYARTV